MILALLAFQVAFALVLAQLSVIAPNELKAVFPADIPFSLGNYGFVPYGETLFGKLELSNPPDGCQPDDMDPTLFEPLDYKKFKLVLRGNCTFAQKTLNAQNQGYTMVVFVDNQEESVERIQMINRNHSLELDIPAILLTEKDGTQLKAAVQRGQTVTMKIKFQIPEPKDVVDYEYWMSTMELESYEFINQFKPFHELMNDSLSFTPHYALWQGIPMRYPPRYCLYCKSQDWQVRNEMCLSGGRYCAPDPDNSGPLIGQDAVLEVVRQVCIFRNYKEQWWSYASAYSEQCLNATVANIQNCANAVQESLLMNSVAIQKCIDDSFDGEDKELADNTILKEEHNLFLSQGIQSWPLLVVNHQQYRGALSLPTSNFDGRDVFDTKHYGPLQLICSGFVNEKMPELCQERVTGYIKDGQIVRRHKYDGSKLKAWVWVISLLVVILFMLLVVFFYRRSLRKAYQQELQLQVNMAVSQYYSLNEQQK